jgi:drug/metabolite transporter (DMT)-like permease
MNSVVKPSAGAIPTAVMAALAACYLVWGSTYLAIKWALPVFPPFFQMGTRFLTAGVLLMLFMRWRGAVWPSGQQWRNALVVGALMLGGGMGLTATAQQSVGSGLIATFIAVVPMMVSGWGLALGQRPSKLELAGMVVGLGGIALLVRGASFVAAPVGLLAILAATLMWSLGSVLQTTRLPLAQGPMGFASEMLCGGAVLMLLHLVTGEVFTWPREFTPGVWRAFGAWIYLVLAGSLVAFSAYLYLLAHARPAVATSYAFVNPVIALLLGVALGGELVHGGEWVACGVILLGVVLILRGKAH